MPTGRNGARRPTHPATASGATSLRWRLLRSAAFAAVTTQLAALGHLVGGGGAPDIAVLAAGGGAAWAATLGLARTRRGPGGILAALLTGQLGFHLLFGIDTHGMAGTGVMPMDPLRMLSFHLIAAALTALVLATGERAVFSLFAALTRSVRIPAPPAAVELPPRWTARCTAFDVPRPEGPLLSTSPRRGPPAGRRPTGRPQPRYPATIGHPPRPRPACCRNRLWLPPAPEGFPCHSTLHGSSPAGWSPSPRWLRSA